MSWGGTLTGLAALALVVGSWAVYWPKIKRVRVPLLPWGHWLVTGVGIGLAIGALAAGGGLVGGAAAVLAVLLGGTFFFLSLASRMPGNTPAVSVGQPILDFTALDSDGNEFSLSSLRGQPFLLKFFRGHW
jgi:hypothetical protein